MIDRILDAAYTLTGVLLPVLIILTYIKVYKIEKKLKDNDK